MRIDCPRCGRTNEVQRLERGANDFCSNCDYPLFWAALDQTDADTAFAGAGLLDPSVRRLPGLEGNIDDTGEPCPRCGEINRADALFCNRCGLEFHPAPPPVPEPPPPAPIPAAPLAVAAPPSNDWLLLLALLFAAVLAVILLAGIIVGVGWWAFGLVVVLGTAGGVLLSRRYEEQRK